MNDREWEEEWASLREKRQVARRRLVTAAGALAAKARDPLGVKEVVRRHPFIVTGVSASVGALLVNMLFSGRGRRQKAREREDGDESARGPSLFGAAIRNVAMSVATPLLTKAITDKLADWFDLNGEAAPVEEGNGSCER